MFLHVLLHDVSSKLCFVRNCSHKFHIWIVSFSHELIHDVSSKLCFVRNCSHKFHIWMVSYSHKSWNFHQKLPAFTKNCFWEIKDDRNRPWVCWKRASIFQMSHSSKKVCFQKLVIKNTICQIFHLKNQKSFDENWRNGGCFYKFRQYCATSPAYWLKTLLGLFRFSLVSEPI